MNRRYTKITKAILCGIVALFLSVTTARAQSATNVLFVGNSYTEVNNLPQMTADIAASMGFEMTWSGNTPGGCTFRQHCTNRSMTLIQNGGWDYVVLQEQSQYPSFPQSQVEAEVFPYAARLVASVYAASPCSEPMFYMTWGRKNGDAGNAPYFPILGTYEGMDSMLYERYVYMAESNDASVCPVGRVWRQLRTNHPDIELYQSDESHPSVAGTYAAACSFFVMFFGGDPAEVTYTPNGVSPQHAEWIRDAVREVVWLQRPQWQRPQPTGSIASVDIDGASVVFTANTSYADSTMWHFGDGTSVVTTDSIVCHNYSDTGIFAVTLVATRHCMTDTAVTTVHIAGDTTTVTGIVRIAESDNRLQIFPNPTTTKPLILLDGKMITPDDEEISVTTPDGRTIPYDTLNEANMPRGVYIVRIRKQGRIVYGKFIKQ